MVDPCTYKDEIIKHGEGIATLNVKMDTEIANSKELKCLIKNVYENVDEVKTQLNLMGIRITNTERSNSFNAGLMVAGGIIVSGGWAVALKFGKPLATVLAAIIK